MGTDKSETKNETARCVPVEALVMPFSLRWWLRLKTNAEKIHTDSMLTAYSLHGMGKERNRGEKISKNYFDHACRYGDLGQWIGERIIKKYGEKKEKSTFQKSIEANERSTQIPNF